MDIRSFAGPRCGQAPDDELRLRPLDRTVLDLRCRKHLSSRTVASRLGIPAEQVERRLAGALRKLDRALRRTDISARRP